MSDEIEVTTGLEPTTAGNGNDFSAAKVISEIMSGVDAVIGESAAYSIIHFGAIEEGRRIASGLPRGDVQGILLELDRRTGQRTELLRSIGGKILVRVTPPPYVAVWRPPMRGLILGLLEGLVSENSRKTYHGRLAKAGPEPSSPLLIALEPSEP